MYAIKMEPKDRKLTTTIKSKIYQGDKNADTLVFVIPKVYNHVNVADCTILLRYILPGGRGVSEQLMMYPIPYNEDYLQYRLSLSSKFTDKIGNILLWLTAVDFDDNIVFQTGTAKVEIAQHIKIDDHLPPESLNELDRLAEKVEELQKEYVDNIRYDEDSNTLQLTADGVPVGDAIDVSDWENKADNLIFHAEDSTIQLTANGEPIGDRIYVSSRTGKLIKNMGISSNGNLVVTYDDDTVEKLGRVVGRDGHVYVPHIDERKILTFTIEDVDGKVPEPVDLNPSDEWVHIDDEPDADADMDYIWEQM